ncbi:MAG TPA: hypothetical protein ENJ18_11500, partial [Nannocystis exedens]|nr:hypothetical protein [Nannocystis exedens]
MSRLRRANVVLVTVVLALSATACEYDSGLLDMSEGTVSSGGSTSGGETTESSSEGDTSDSDSDTTGSDDTTGNDSDPDTGTNSNTPPNSDEDTVFPPGPWDAGYPIPAEPQEPGDPEIGFDALFNRGYVSCGLPSGLFAIAKPLLGVYADGEALPWRKGKNATVPYNWTIHTAKSGVELASMNCLECHAGRFNGEMIIGLGTADMDFTASLSMGLNELPQVPLPGKSIDELNKFIARYNAVGPLVQTKTIGTNPATVLGVLLATHHDVDTLAWSDEPLIDVDVPMIPVDAPPWWRIRKRAGLFYNGMARGDHRGTMMFASSLCTDTVEEATEILSYFNHINAYIRSLEAPSYPFPIDPVLAADGAQIFTADCAGCHGTYSHDPEAETYRNLLLPYELIGTDAAYVLAADGSIGALADWYNNSFYGAITRVEPTIPFAGYVAPPLDGIWATAPFLHNGSVPNLELVLNSKARPTYWRRLDYESDHFDTKALGWPFETLEAGHDAVPEAERKYIYDTTIFAHSASGHTFGDHLS